MFRRAAPDDFAGVLPHVAQESMQLLPVTLGRVGISAYDRPAKSAGEARGEK